MTMKFEGIQREINFHTTQTTNQLRKFTAWSAKFDKFGLFCGGDIKANRTANPAGQDVQGSPSSALCTHESSQRLHGDWLIAVPWCRATDSFLCDITFGRKQAIDDSCISDLCASGHVISSQRGLFLSQWYNDSCTVCVCCWRTQLVAANSRKIFLFVNFTQHSVM